MLIYTKTRKFQGGGTPGSDTYTRFMNMFGTFGTSAIGDLINGISPKAADAVDKYTGGFISHTTEEMLAANRGPDSTKFKTAQDTANNISMGIIGGKVLQKIIPYVPGLLNKIKNPLASKPIVANTVTKPSPLLAKPAQQKPVVAKDGIDWGKWNKEIPANKALMQEYAGIEKAAKANGTWMKNPDGSAFNGSPEQFIQQKSKNFAAYFNESKVVDAAGNPQVVFHGTRTSEGIDKSGFLAEMTGKGNKGAAEGNFYFSNTKKNADYTGIGEDRNFSALFERLQSVQDHFKGEVPTSANLYNKIESLKAKYNALSHEYHGLRPGIFNKKAITSKKEALTKEMEALSAEQSRIGNVDMDLAKKFHAGIKYIGGQTTGWASNPLGHFNTQLYKPARITQKTKDMAINATYNTKNLKYSPKVYEAYLNIKAPSRKDFRFTAESKNPLLGDRFEQQRYSDNYGFPALEELAKPKYDGAIQTNLFDVLFGDVFIAKKAGQIKSAVGNNGMFNASNPNIYKALAAPVGLGTVLANSGEGSYRAGGIFYKR